MFETDRIPLGWVSRCNRMDEVWVPTGFHKAIFEANGVDSGKLRVVPEAVDVDFFDPKKRERVPLFPNQGERFIFFSVFKWEDRKGWDILLKAYLEEFSTEADQSKVALVILTHDYHTNEENSPKVQMAKLIGALGILPDLLPKVEVIDRHIPTAELPTLYRSVDALVIPSHGEGWGRPHVEAMAMELPIIATNWSGPIEFMTEANSYPLPIEPELVFVGNGPFADHKWAQPSLPELKRLMRHLVNNPSEAKEKGKQARRDMVEKFSPEKVGEIAQSEIERILKKFELPSQNQQEEKKEL